MKTIDISEAARLVKEGAEITHAERMKLADKRLHALVDYAREHSPYLREKYRNLPASYTLADIQVTEKAEMIDHYGDYVTDREIRLADVEAYCDDRARKAGRFLGRYTVLHTSGTTGAPLYMVRDDHRNKLQGQLVGQRLLKGLPSDIMDHTRHRLAAVIYAAPGASSYESYLRSRASAPGFEDRVIAINVLEEAETIVRRLNEFQPEVLTGYASVLVLLALEKLKGKLDIPVRAIFNSAETLTRENHLLIERAFGCPVKNNYCMTEGGEIAMTQDGPDMLYNEDFIIVEPCDEQRRPVTDPEQWSQGILITDLTNYVQPVIRYYVSDSVKIEPVRDDTVRLPILKIHGRTNDIFELCGKTFATGQIDTIAEFYPGVVRFQLVQLSDAELQLRAYTADEATREKTLAGLAGAFDEYFRAHGCPDAVVSYATDPLIKKKRGGKMPVYVRL